MRGDPQSMRASHSDRGRVENELRLAFQEGRLQIHELEERLELVNQSQTYADLERCLVDLPNGKALMRQMSSEGAGVPVMPQRYLPQAPMRRRRGRWGNVWSVVGILFALQIFLGSVGSGASRGAGFLILVAGAGFVLLRRSLRRW